MKLSIANDAKESLLNELKKANLQFQKKYPGDKPDRQPVHTVYGGANLFKSDTAVKIGETALRNLATYAPDFITLAKVLQLQGYEYLPEPEIDIKELTSKLNNMSEDERKKNLRGWLTLYIIKSSKSCKQNL